MAQPIRTPEEKAKIVAEYKEALGKQPGSATAVAKKYGVSSSLIHYWMDGKPRSRNPLLRDDEKAKIIADVFKHPEGKERSAAALAHGVPMSTLYKWKRDSGATPPAPRVARAEAQPATVPDSPPSRRRNKGPLVLTPDEKERLNKEVVACKGWEDYRAVAKRWGISDISVYGRWQRLTGHVPRKRGQPVATAPEPVPAELVPARAKGRRGRAGSVEGLVQVSNIALERMNGHGSSGLASAVKRMLADCIRYGRSIGIEVVSVAVSQGTVTVTTQSTETIDL